MDTVSKEIRSKIMKNVKSKNTKIELMMRKALWAKGYRYRKNYKKVIGCPDICFPSIKLAIFCDSEFWHGKYFLEDKQIPKSNQNYWIEKFEKNIRRDKEVNLKLKKDGWTVLRFWEKDIEEKLTQCLEKIEMTICNLKIDK